MEWAVSRRPVIPGLKLRSAHVRQAFPEYFIFPLSVSPYHCSVPMCPRLYVKPSIDSVFETRFTDMRHLHYHSKRSSFKCTSRSINIAFIT